MTSNVKITLQNLLERTRNAQYNVKENTREGWYDVGQLNTAIQENERKEYLFRVDIPADPENPSNDVLNLQYYFVRTERALRTKRELGEDAVFILLVTVHSEDDYFRVSSYLHLQSAYRKDMLFYISHNGRLYEPQNVLKGIGRLCPLICVSRDRTEHNLFYAELLGNGRLKKEQIECCRDKAKEFLRLESKKKSRGKRDAQAVPDEEADPDSEAMDQDGSNASTEKKMSRFQSLIKSAEFKRENGGIDLPIITANYLMEGLCKIKGIKGNSLQVEEKCALIDEVCDYILQRNDSLTLLGQLVWFLYLYYIQDSNEFIEWTHDEHNEKVRIARYDRLEKSFMDSVEYTDGILQLLENSCQHTQSGVGYLSIRVHYVDKKNCQEGELADVAASRSRLINRYSHGFTESSRKFDYFPRRMEINDNAPYYFELRIVDDATYYDENSGESSNTVRARGIVEMYGYNNGLSKAELPHLYQIFGRLVEEDERRYGQPKEPTPGLLDSITHHYGVRLLQKIILRNRGRFVVVTPGKESGFTDIYSTCYELSLPKKQKSTARDGESVDDRTTVFRNAGWKQITHREACRSTEYQILLPLSYRWVDTEKEKTNHIQPTPLPIDLYALEKNLSYIPITEHCLADEFGPVFEAHPYFTYNAGPARDETPPDELPQAKINITGVLSDRLDSLLADQGDTTKIHVLNFSALSGTELELSTKALFRYIGKRKLARPVGGDDDSRLLFAACFDHVLQAQEFIMNYSIFYDEYGVNPFMENVQIAVCTIKADASGGAGMTDTLPEVNFLLTGTSLSTSWKTAETFAFYNSNRTLSLLPQLQYLSDNSFWGRVARKGPEGIAAFPFDIYLRTVPGARRDDGGDRAEPERIEAVNEDLLSKRTSDSSDVAPARSWDCWFLRHMASLIEGNIQDPDIGCMIKDVHVRLGSRMHIEDFYEAELLFQNISVVNRFAYMIVQAILKNKPKAKTPLLIVGYENYSTILLEYVVSFLKKCGKDAAYGLYGYHAGGEGEFSPSAALRGKDSEFWETCHVITIYPIGTTLSTIYQMIDSVHMDRGVDPYMNFCLLIVSDKNEQHTLRKKFWIKEIEKEQRRETNLEDPSVLTIRKDKAQREEMDVNYFLEAKTFWHDAQECINDKPEAEEVLTYVDSTSTIPNMIFPLASRKNDGPSSFLKNSGSVRKNDERLGELKGCLYYGHINAGNNHFLYDIDLPLYFEHVRSRRSGDLRGWLNDLHEVVDAEAFNVIVAPLDRDNAAFLREVVDRVFAHSIRVLRIPFLESRKEDIRAKFSFIAQEYRRIKAINPSMNINIYYVSMSVVTGETFYRASKLISMLLDDSGLRKKNDFLFKGVFLLVNRSSRSTIQTMVEDPDRGFHAYLQLSVPNYNTYKGICPACIRSRRNQAVIRNCSTNICSDMFLRIEDKLTLRSRKEHRRWLKQELFHSERGFTMLCLWLYRHREKSIPGFNEAEKERLMRSCMGIQERNTGGGICLEDHLKEILDGLEKGADFTEEKLRTSLNTLWMDEVLQDIAYLRLSCTHNAYSALEDDELLQTRPEDLPEKTRERILGLFMAEQARPPEEFIEWIISYVKVLSREYLAKHYYIRKSVFKILSELLRFMLDEPLTDEAQKKMADVLAKCKKALPLQQYQLLITVLRQLAGMQANMIMRNDILLDIKNEIGDLRMKQQSEKKPWAALCPLPPEKQIDADYERCVKWDMLSGDEGNKCFLLSDQQSIWKERGE